MSRERGGLRPEQEVTHEREVVEVENKHLDALRSRFDNKMRGSTIFTDEEGNREGVLDASRNNKLRDFSESNMEGTVRVMTQAGAIVKKDREMYTEGVAGCIGIFIQGQDKNAMIHCTPNYGFAHTRPEQTSKIIKEQLEGSGMKLEDVSVTIIGTMGRESGKFGYEEENEGWNELSDALKKEGASSVGIAEVPVMDMTLYYSPDEPGKLLAMGDRAFYDEEGRYRSKRKERKEYMVDLNSTEKQEFGIVRPEAKVGVEDDDEDDGPYKFTFS